MGDIKVVLDINGDVLDQAERKATSEGRDLNEVIVGMIATFVSRTEDVEDAKPPERGSR